MKTDIKVQVRHNGIEVVASWVENGVTHLRVQSIQDFLDEFDGNRSRADLHLDIRHLRGYGRAAKMPRLAQGIVK